MKSGFPSTEPWGAMQRVLVARLDNIGDVIMLSPALRALKTSMPEAEITLWASPGGAQVAPLLPWVADVIPWRSVWQDVSGALPQDAERELGLVAEFQRRSFDAAFIFTSFSQSPYPPGYLCYLAGIPVRVGQSKEFGGSILSHNGRSPADEIHQVDRNLALLELAGLPLQGRHMELRVPAGDQARVDDLLAGAGVDPQTPFVTLAPGASCNARRYPAARFAQAARLLAEQHGLTVVVAGSAREVPTIQPVIDLAGQVQRGRVVSLVGQTSVTEFAGLVKRSAVVIANNSSALHLADAFRTPVVVLYSGTEWISQWQPRFSPARVLNREVECSPCFRFNCPYQLECLDIAPQEVVEATLELLSAPRPAQPVNTPTRELFSYTP